MNKNASFSEITSVFDAEAEKNDGPPDALGVYPLRGDPLDGPEEAFTGPSKASKNDIRYYCEHMEKTTRQDELRS